MELNLKTQQNKLISLFRVSLMFFLFFFVQQTVTSSQSITLPSHNITIKDAFSEIEKQTGMSVDYDESVINLNKQVNASVNNKSLNETLALILKESGCTFVIRNNHIIISAQTVQQQQKQVTISGTVSDNLGPIAGANVVEKGTTNGIITDMDGNYTLSVPQGAVIQFSYIGYVTKEITVDSQKNINVQLAEDAQKLDEVVVVGYGTAKKSDLAGSVVRADLGTLQESPNISLGSALQGTVPGLNVSSVSEAGKDPDMSIRGRTSISGGNSPLIVLDGIIFRGNMVDINMNDVESIDILKDASAAAIYGSEASNGVILITSKTGKVMSKPTIEYSGSFSYQQPTNKDMYPEGRDGFLRKIADRFLEESRIGDDMLQPNPNWDPTSHLMDRNALDGYENGTETDWWNMLTNKTPYIQNHNLSVRGKNELSSYFFSMGYTDQKNLVINDTYKRYNIRINMDTKITSFLKVGVQSFFTVSDYSGESPDLSTVVGLPPIVAATDENGDYIREPYKNHKFGVFPSAALAWRISEEDFFKNNVDWMENLKLRLSYGQNGNRTVGRYQTMAQMGAGVGSVKVDDSTVNAGYLFGDGVSAEQMQWIKSLANADLKWETTNTFNIAADFSALNSRIFGTVEYYTSQTNNLLFNINIPQMNGLDKIPSNIGKMSNKGFEMTVTGIPIETKDFSWDVTFNFSRNRNKVKSILGIDADGDGREDDLISDKIFINHPYGVCYDYNIIGMWQIADKQNGLIPDGFEYGTYKVEDVNNDGKYTADKDRKIIGYSDPAYRFSIQNSFRYKNWEFKFMINSVQGGKNYYYGQPGKDLANPDNIYQNNLFNFDYWTPENPNARYRQLGYYTQALGYTFSPYVQRSFVRLQDVTLSYNVPASFLSKFKVNRLKLYVTGKNLLTFTDWDGWDPETGTGLNTSKYPVMRSYSIGLNLEF